MSNTLNSMLGQSQGLGNTIWTTPSTGTISTTQYANPYAYGFMQPASIEREHKIEVPVIEKGDRAGLFLKDEKGQLIHIDSERLYKAFCDW